jgi:hypothetical protein
LLGVSRVDGDHTPPWRGVVRLEIEDWPVVPHEAVRGIEIVQQPYDRRVQLWPLWINQILVVDAVSPVSPEPHGVDREAAVGADLDREAPVGMIRSFVDESIRGLFGAEAVVIDPLVAIHLEQRIRAGGGFGVEL